MSITISNHRLHNVISQCIFNYLPDSMSIIILAFAGMKCKYKMYLSQETQMYSARFAQIFQRQSEWRFITYIYGQIKSCYGARIRDGLYIEGGLAEDLMKGYLDNFFKDRDTIFKSYENYSKLTTHGRFFDTTLRNFFKSLDVIFRWGQLTLLPEFRRHLVK